MDFNLNIDGNKKIKSRAIKIAIILSILVPIIKILFGKGGDTTNISNDNSIQKTEVKIGNVQGDNVNGNKTINNNK